MFAASSPEGELLCICRLTAKKLPIRKKVVQKRPQAVLNHKL